MAVLLGVFCLISPGVGATGTIPDGYIMAALAPRTTVGGYSISANTTGDLNISVTNIITVAEDSGYLSVIVGASIILLGLAAVATAFVTYRWRRANRRRHRATS